MTDAEVFEEYRGLMFAVAYRMLGTITDAEDAVQDAWLRWSAGSRAPEINGMPGTLITAGGQAVAALTLTVCGCQVTAIQLLANPDKLTAIMAGRTLPPY
jgi:hypothetical protein